MKTRKQKIIAQSVQKQTNVGAENFLPTKYGNYKWHIKIAHFPESVQKVCNYFEPNN